MATIFLIAALILFIIDASAKLSARTAGFFGSTGLQSAGLACLVASLLFGIL